MTALKRQPRLNHSILALMNNLDPEAIDAFENSLKELPLAEAQQRKSAFLSETIETYGRELIKDRKRLILMGIASVLFLPLFFVTIPVYSIYLSTKRIKTQKIRWTLDRWQETLGKDYDLLYQKFRNY